VSVEPQGGIRVRRRRRRMLNERKKEIMMLLKVTVLMVHIVGSISAGANLSWGHSQGRCMCSVVSKMRLPLLTKTALVLVCHCCISQVLSHLYIETVCSCSWP
jgi:hypothetical protein